MVVSLRVCRAEQKFRKYGNALDTMRTALIKYQVRLFVVFSVLFLRRFSTRFVLFFRDAERCCFVLSVIICVTKLRVFQFDCVSTVVALV